MITISAVVITRNEERNIGRCLESIQGVADEIIIIDSGSTDSTRSICTNYETRFETHAFEGYAAQKNYGNSLAIGDYILSLDADEALGEALKKDILEFKKNPISDAVEMKRLTNYCGQWIRHGGWYPDKKFRLWKCGKAKWGGPPVHEKLVIAPGSSTHFMNSDILHYSYYTFAEHKKRAIYYAGLGSAALAGADMQIPFPLIYMKTIAKFIRNYFILSGFLDGINGLRISYISAMETYLKYRTRYLAQKEKTR